MTSPDDQTPGPETDDDPFAEDAFDDADSGPLGEYGGAVTDEDDALFDEYEIPPTPIGVLPGYIKGARYAESTDQNGRPKKSLVLDVQCTAVEYQNSGTISIWLELPKDISRATKIARALGLGTPRKVVDGRQRVGLPRPDQWANRTGLFVFCTWTNREDEKVPQIARFGVPKEGTCEQFDSWAEQNLSESQIKTIKRYNGVCPSNVLGA